MLLALHYYSVIQLCSLFVKYKIKYRVLQVFVNFVSAGMISNSASNINDKDTQTHTYSNTEMLYMICILNSYPNLNVRLIKTSTL